MALTIKVQVNLDTRHNGWAYVATLDHSHLGRRIPGGWAGANLVHHVPGREDDLPEEYRTTGRDCDHCGLVRQRRDTYVVHEEETDAYRQVGRSCLADYLGAGPAGRISALAKFHARLRRLTEDEDLHRPVQASEFQGLDCLRFLTYAASSIRQLGFHKSRSQRPTREDAYSRMVKDAQDARQRPPVARPGRPSQEDRTMARNALAWAAHLGDGGATVSDYEHNLRTVASSPFLNTRDLGVAASLVWAYMRTLVSADQGRVRSSYFAKAGDVIGYTPTQRERAAGGEQFPAMEVEVERVLDMGASYYRPDTQRVMVRMVTDDGATLVWWTESTYTGSLEPGGRYVLKAKVKALKAYRGECQTVVTRAKLRPVPTIHNPVPTKVHPSLVPQGRDDQGGRFAFVPGDLDDLVSRTGREEAQEAQDGPGRAWGGRV